MKRRLRESVSAILHFLTPVRLIVISTLVVFFWFIILGDKGIYQLRRLLDLKMVLIQERQALNEEIDRLNEEKNTLSDPANLEMIIRSELGYIKPGETVFEDKK